MDSPVEAAEAVGLKILQCRVEYAPRYNVWATYLGSMVEKERNPPTGRINDEPSSFEISKLWTRSGSKPVA